MVPDPEKAKVVRQIFEWVQNGAYLTDVEQLFWDKGITEQPPYVSVMETFF